MAGLRGNIIHAEARRVAVLSSSLMASRRPLFYGRTSAESISGAAELSEQPEAVSDSGALPSYLTIFHLLYSDFAERLKDSDATLRFRYYMDGSLFRQREQMVYESMITKHLLAACKGATWSGFCHVHFSLECLEMARMNMANHETEPERRKSYRRDVRMSSGMKAMSSSKGLLDLERSRCCCRREEWMHTPRATVPAVAHLP
jgi:hypothetical protein